MPDTPDFYTRATAQLRAANGDDTVVLATLNGGLMCLQTCAPRGAAELVQIARRILDTASDMRMEAEADNLAKPHADLRCQIEDALAMLLDMNADDDDGEA